MNKLAKEKRIQILQCLLEGNSIRSTARITGASKNTVIKLLVDSGKACKEFQEEKMRNLTCKNIQVDELWSFIYSKKKKTKNVPGKGDSWTWVAICSDTKIVPVWHVAKRDAQSADVFIEMLSKRISHNVQITSDGLQSYQPAIEKHMRHAKFGMLVKHYIKNKKGGNLVIYKNEIRGKVDKAKISTSFIERQNLNIRMVNRRFTRKTNAFSKKFENHCHALSLYFYYYNFIRVHKTLRTTPANAMGIIEELDLGSILDLTG